MTAMVSQERKEWFRSLLDPLARLLVQAKIDPNTLTIGGLLLALVAAGCLASGHLRSGAILLLAGGIFDTLDGAVARLSGRGSRFGAFLDSTIDRYAEILPYLALSYQMRGSALFLLPFVGITGSLMVSYTRARIEGLGGTCAVGLLERPERVAILVLGLLLGDFFLGAALVLLAAGSHWTAFQRMRHAKRVL